MSRAAQKARLDAYALREQHKRTWNRQERPVPESEATFTLDRQIAEARKSMGEDRWAELNAEWSDRSALRDGEG